MKELPPRAYDPASNNESIFLTYPNLGSLQNFTSLNFTRIIKALNAIADNLAQLSAFSFLDEPLPFVNLSVPTVNTPIRHIYEKIHVQSRRQAVAIYANLTNNAGLRSSRK